MLEPVAGVNASSKQQLSYLYHVKIYSVLLKERILQEMA
jgi:hypothetical protein